MFPILAAAQAAMGVVDAKKKENEARRTNAARAALGEAPTADPGGGTMGALMNGIGGIAGAMDKQPKAPEKPVAGPKSPMYSAEEAYPNTGAGSKPLSTPPPAVGPAMAGPPPPPMGAMPKQLGGIGAQMQDPMLEDENANLMAG
jgi:hypothetical protein